MKKIYTYLAMFVAAATMVACENAPEGNVTPDATGKPINITIGAQDRALLDLTDGKSVTWEAGDQIGLFHHVNGSVQTANNTPYTAEAAGATATFKGEATWSGTAEDTHNIYVYYPYRDRANTAENIVVQMTKDQTYDVTAPTWRVGATYGFAYAKVNGATYGQNVTIPAMKQYFGILRLNITNGTTEDVTISKVTATVSSTFIYASHRLDITGDEAVLADIKDKGKTLTTTVSNGLVKAGESIDIRLVVSPNDYSGDTFSITIESDKGVHPAVEFTGGNIAQGGRASKAITLAAAPTSSYKLLDVVEDGVLFWMSDDKKSGKVVSGVAGNYAFSSEAKAIADATLYGAANQDDGTVNITAMKNYATNNGGDFATLFPAANFCDTLEGGEWYLPASYELQALFATYVGFATHAATNGMVWADSADARAAFDAIITAAPLNGTALAGGITLSSSELSSGSAVRDVYFNQRKPGSHSKSSARIVRCIKVVSLTE